MSHARSQSRYYLVQAIYQWQMTGEDIGEIQKQFLSRESQKSFNVPYFKRLLYGILTDLKRLDDQLSPCLDRSIESVDPVERAILRLGTYELMSQPEVPYKVAINEAVELAKVFGAEQGHKYINGVLDKLAKVVRKGELCQSPNSS